MLKRMRGLSLVELVVSMAILVILMGAAVPALGDWLFATRARSTAETLREGLILARMEAVRRNTTVVFRLTPGGGRMWSVGCDNTACNSVLQSAPLAEAGQLVLSGTNASGGLATQVNFSGLGNLTDSHGLRHISISNKDGELVRQLHVLAGGTVRICDAAGNHCS